MLEAPPTGPRLVPPPAPLDPLVPRPRLVSRLADSAAPVALLAAPAGFGKTTLLSEWQRSDPRPFAWVTLDSGHDSIESVAAAVEQALDQVGAAAEPARGSERLERLVRSLPARGAFVLVLDDLHALAGAPLAAVRTLAHSIPDGCCLALASRTEPALPIGRMRASRALTELRARDLMMTTGEARALLGGAGLHASAAQAEALARKVEGWPAGLYLAAVALRDERDLGAAIERFGGDDAIVSDYLRDEVLSQLAPAAASFLVRTSVLDRLSGPICDAVLHGRGSARTLSSLGRAKLLLVPLDGKDDAYRCHRLLAQMLRAELRRTEPQEAGLLHRRASDWHGERGDVDRAVHHAVSAGDSRRAATLLGTSAPAYVTPSRNATLRRWLAMLPAEHVASEPALTLAAANSSLLEGRLDAVYLWRATASGSLDRAGSPAADAGVAILQAALAADGVVRMGEEAARGYELLAEDSPWRPVCCLLEGVSRQLMGDLDAGEARLEEGVRRATVGAPNIQTLCLAQLALTAAEREDWGSAAACSARAMAQVERNALHEYPSSALVFAVSALVRTHEGRVEEAQRDFEHATRLTSLLTDYMPWYEVECRVALAQAAQRLSHTACARALLAEAVRLTRRAPDAMLLHDWIGSTRARLDSASAAQDVLTTAELRILRFLPTHLSFREIAGRLYVSANTVKTQAHAVYRKLDSASRSEAVARALQLGLLDG